MPYERILEKRSIPVKVWITLIFGRFATNFGLIFIGFAMVFIVVFSGIARFEKLSSSSPQTMGVVLSVSPTNSKVNDRRVYSYEYRYNHPTGGEVYGVSYSEKASFVPSDTIAVQFSERNATVSRIVGLRSGEIGAWIYLIFLPFLLIGIGFLSFSIRTMLKVVSLLQVGQVSYGMLTKMEETSMLINNSRVYKMHFKFKTKNGKEYTTTCRTHKIMWLQDDEQEKLLYNPNHPEQALMLDSLPRSMKDYIKSIQ